MSTTDVTPARTHAQANELLRRPFAPGAIGFRAMSKTPLGNDPYGGAQIAAYLAAQSVVQRLNCVVPGRWRQQFAPIPPELHPAQGGEGRAARRRYLACRLILTLPLTEGGPDVEAAYEDIGEMDAGSLAGTEGAVLRRAQARRRRRRHRRLPVHRARVGRAADRPRPAPRAGDPPARQERPAHALP